MGWHYVGVEDVPKCCKGCENLDFDSKDEYSSNYYYCIRGLYLPTKKQTCKIKLLLEEK